MHRSLIITGLASAVLLLFFGPGLGEHLDFHALRETLEAIRLRARAEPLASGGLFFGLTLAAAALNMPGTFLILAPAAGSIFGTVTGAAWMSLGSSMGATISFLTARHLLRDYFEDRFAFATARVNRGLDAEGVSYLFGLRLVPLVPFFAINPLMGLTRLRTWTFFWVSLLGMLPVTLLYVNAGAEVGRIDSLGGLLSPTLVGSFALLAACPLLARRGLAWLRRTRAGRDVTTA